MKTSLLTILLVFTSFYAESHTDNSEIESLCVSSAVLVRGAVNDASILTSMLSGGQKQRAINTAAKLGNGQGGDRLLVSNEQYRAMVGSMVGDASILRMNSGGMDYSSIATQYMSGQYEEKCLNEPKKYIINYDALVK